MPCTGGGPSTYEYVWHTAKLLVWLQGKLGVKSDTIDRVMSEEQNTYEFGMADEVDNILTPKLCALIKGMSDKQVDSIIYNPRDKMARQLASWWESHQEADRQREEQEQHEAEQERLRQQGEAKLTPEERKALGLNKRRG